MANEAEALELTPDIIDDLKAKYGSVYRVKAKDKVIVVKEPDDKVFQRFRDYNADPARRSIAMKKLVDDTVVWPPKPEFEAMVKKQPGLYESWGDEVGEIAGLTRQTESEKL